MNLSSQVVTELVTEWRSDLVLGEGARGDLAGWDVTRWNLDGGGTSLTKVDLTSDLEAQTQWAPLCEPRPRFIPQNNTLLRSIVTGAEVRLPRPIESPIFLLFKFYPC